MVLFHLLLLPPQPMSFGAADPPSALPLLLVVAAAAPAANCCVLLLLRLLLLLLLPTFLASFSAALYFWRLACGQVYTFSKHPCALTTARLPAVMVLLLGSLHEQRYGCCRAHGC
jgi:hypothetical protein